MIPAKSDLAGARTVVMGGCGLLGSAAAAALVLRGAEVVALDARDPGADAVPGVEYRLGDICDETAIRDVVRGADAVFAFAGGIGATPSLSDPLLDLRTSCEAQLVLLEAVRLGCPKAAVVLPGSRLEYGRPEYLPVDERHALGATSPYAANRSACAAYYRIWNEVFSLHTCVLRLANVYGTRPAAGGAARGFGVLNIFADIALSGGEIQVFGDGAQLRDFVHVDDVIEAALAAAAAPDAAGGVFNIGSGSPVSVADAADTVVAACGTGSVRTGVPWPPDAAAVETGDFYFDISRACSILGWRPRIDLHEGVARLVASSTGEAHR